MSFKNSIKYFLILFSICFSQLKVSAMTLTDYISQYNPQDAPIIADAIYKTSNKYDLDPLFVASVFNIESNYHNNAISSAGAMGIAQLMPGTAAMMNVNPNNPLENIEGGVRYLREMLDLQPKSNPYRYNLALASYNAGPGNVNGYIPSYTYDYIQSIKDEYEKLNHIIDRDSSPLPNRNTTVKAKRLTRKARLKNAIRRYKQEKYKKKHF